jgi:predicted RNA-binding Zn-ribbon protein involved in translation (DUF1610 family)
VEVEVSKDRITTYGEQVSPSFHVKHSRIYLDWCSITVCSQCKRTAKYEDQHPVDPCPNCGSKKIRERVGRWNLEKPTWEKSLIGYMHKLYYMFGILVCNAGHWEVLEETERD